MSVFASIRVTLGEFVPPKLTVGVPTKYVPEMVTTSPPALVTCDGVTDVTVGVAKYVYEPGSDEVWPSRLTTATSTVASA